MIRCQESIRLMAINQAKLVYLGEQVFYFYVYFFKGNIRNIPYIYTVGISWMNILRNFQLVHQKFSGRRFFTGRDSDREDEGAEEFVGLASWNQ